MKQIGTLFTISAPSGAGKTSLVKSLVESTENICVSISHTTRPPRPGEVDGINYHFVNTTQFNEMLEHDAFLEHATVFNNLYGTSKKWVEDTLNSGQDVILEIDWQGADQIADRIDNCISIFILPPSRQSLLERLKGRGQDDDEVIQSRMREAENEMAHHHSADYIVINDTFETAAAELKSIIQSSRLRQSVQKIRHDALLKGLLNKP